jgi:uncharacterized protein YijF (DUF1287 family)
MSKQSTLDNQPQRNSPRRAFKVLGALLVLLCVAIFTVPLWLPLKWVQLTYPQAKYLYGVRHNPPRSALASKIVAGARTQIGTRYDASYVTIAYPGGDVPSTQGACTDVVVRSLRAAGYDLQKLIHEDMRKRWDKYPRTWGLAAPNANIDHRRVPNQMVFLRKHGRELTKTVNQSTLGQWQPGDLVYWRSGPRRLHTGVLSDTTDANDVPLVIHNGYICVEDNCLTRWPIIGHFRFPN